MPKSFLPDKDTPQGQALINEYLICDTDKLDQLAIEYGYRTRNNFIDAMRRFYGSRRGKEVCPLTIKSEHKNQYVKQSDSNNTYYKLDTNGGHKVAAVINDAHNPFGDAKVLKLLDSFLTELQPDYLFIPGDWWDMYQLSKFDKNPLRINNFQDDINSGITTLYFLRKHLPNTKFIFCDGNHEDRLRKYNWHNVPELSSISSFNIPDLCKFKDMEIDYVPKDKILRVNDIFNVEHSDVVSKHSGWTAKAMYERRGGCGIVGHSHRGGSYFKVDSDSYGWWENFCLCDLHPEYVKNPNWMHGFSVLHFIGKRFYVEQVPIIKNKFVYSGKLYE